MAEGLHGRTHINNDATRSRIGLNAANFLQAEAVGVVLPILNTFLKEAHWRYDQIGIATAIAGLGTLLFQTPAGYLVDRLMSRRALFAFTSLGVGICFGLIPFVPRERTKQSYLPRRVARW